MIPVVCRISEAEAGSPAKYYEAVDRDIFRC